MSEPMGLLGRAQLQQEFTQTKLRAEKLQVLHSIGCSLTSSLDLEAMLTRIVEAAVYITSAEEGSLLLLDEQTKELHLRAQKGLGETHARGFSIRTADSIAGEVIQSNKPQRLMSSERVLKVVTGYIVSSILYVPVAIENRVIGVLAVDNQTPDRSFTEDDENMLKILAGYAAIALDNARLREELESRAYAPVALPPAGLEPIGPGAVSLLLHQDPAPPPSQALSPHHLATVVSPFLNAIAQVQRILDEMSGQATREIRILTITYGQPVAVTIEGVAPAVEALSETLLPWRQEYASSVAELVEKEGEAAIEQAWAEILEARARATQARVERKKVLTQIESQRVEVTRKGEESKGVRSGLQRAKLQLALDLVDHVAPDLSDGDKIVRAIELLPALETIVASPLEFSTMGPDA